MMAWITKVYYLTKKEFFSTLFSPIAFVVATVFLGVAGYNFYSGVRLTNISTLRFLFDRMSFFMSFIIPFITMRTFSEEKKSGTLESLLTLPITDFQLVLSKFFGTLAFFMFLLLPTVGYFYFLYNYGGTPDKGELITGYFGMILLGSVYISFGMMCSSLTKDQIIAASISCVGLVSLNMLITATLYVDARLIDTILYLTPTSHMEDFNKGVIDTKGLMYFLTLIIMFIFFTYKVIETKKWR